MPQRIIQLTDIHIGNTIGRSFVEDVVKRSAEAALTFVTDGIETAMNRYNR